MDDTERRPRDPHDPEDLFGMDLSPCEWGVVVDYADTGSMKDTASNLQISYETVRSYWERARLKTGAHTAIDLYTAIGWLVVPRARPAMTP